jgi:AraC-like DNA-binding protein
MTRRPRKEGTRVTSRSAAAEHLRDLVWLRRVRDRIDREYAQPLDLQALARSAHTSAGHLSRQFRLAYGESPYGYVMTRRIGRAMALLSRGDRSVTEVCFAEPQPVPVPMSARQRPHQRRVQPDDLGDNQRRAARSETSPATAGGSEASNRPAGGPGRIRRSRVAGEAAVTRPAAG